MVFKLVETTQCAWRRLDGRNQLPKVYPWGVKCVDGLKVSAKPTTNRRPATSTA
jgi:hypothetical protein